MKRSTLLFKGFSLLSASFLLVPGVVGAVEKKGAIEEIFVTAQKREQKVFDIPMSVDVLSAKDIENKGLEDLNDISFAVPGLTFREEAPGVTTLVMRGIGNSVGAGSLTSIYLDEAPVNLGRSGNAATNTSDILGLTTTDLERVEVLRGPQGTLYGAGAVTGAVRFITNDPNLDSFGWKGDVALSFTKNGDPTQAITGIFNIPIVENEFGIRVVSRIENQGGWIDQPTAANGKNVNNKDLVDIRVKTLWQPTSSFNLKATALVHKNESDVGTSFSDESYVYIPPTEQDRKFPFDSDSELYNLTMTYDLGVAELLSSSTYIDLTQDDLTIFKDVNGQTLFPTYGGTLVNDRNAKVFTQEVRLTSNSSTTPSWTIGAYYRDDKTRLASDWFNIYGGFEFPSFYDNGIESESWAVFGDISYELTEKFELGGGLRYFEDDRKVTNYADDLEEDATFDELTWRTYLSYEVSDNINTYATIATGFRSGGFNPIPGITAPTYAPENLISYELGTKLALLDNRLNVDLALFYSEYEDMLQRSLFFLDGTLRGIVANVGEAEVKGADISVSWQVVDALTLGVSAAVSDGEIVKADLNNPSGSQDGDPLDFIADYSYTVSAEYRFNWQSDIPGFIQLDFNTRDKITRIDRSTCCTPPTPSIMESDKIELLNARVGAQWGRWSAQLFGNNLLNDDGSTTPSKPWSMTTRPQPRTIGIKFGVDFD